MRKLRLKVTRLIEPLAGICPGESPSSLLGGPLAALAGEMRVWMQALRLGTPH